MTSIFEGQPLNARPFRTKRRVVWVPGISWNLSKYFPTFGETVHIFQPPVGQPTIYPP